MIHCRSSLGFHDPFGSCFFPLHATRRNESPTALRQFACHKYSITSHPIELLDDWEALASIEMIQVKFFFVLVTANAGLQDVLERSRTIRELYPRGVDVAVEMTGAKHVIHEVGG